MACSSGRCCKTFHLIRVLADIAAHAAFRHVGTGEIQFHSIRTVLFTQTCQFSPLLLVLTHDGCKNELGRVLRLQTAESLHVLCHAVVGQLLDVLEPNDTAVIAGNRRKARRSLMDVQCTDGLETCACPAGLKSTRAHVICACDDRGGKQERVLQRNPADITFQSFLIRRDRRFTGWFDLVIQSVDQVTDRDLTRTEACALTGCIAGQTGICIRQFLRSCLLILEPDTAQQLRRFQGGTGSITRSVGTECAPDHVSAWNARITSDHT